MIKVYKESRYYKKINTISKRLKIELRLILIKYLFYKNDKSI
jgi:hypothetical protein